MDHQIITTTYSENKHDPISISKGDVLKNCSIQFGSFSNVVTQQKYIIEVPSASQAMPGKVSIGANINKEESNRPYVKIGSMLVMLEGFKDGIDTIHGFPRMWSTFHSSYMRPQVHPITESQDMENLKSIRTQVSSARQTQSKIFISPTYDIELE
jgi:hypothetical protein